MGKSNQIDRIKEVEAKLKESNKKMLEEDLSFSAYISDKGI
jgi:hypothetical protein